MRIKSLSLILSFELAAIRSYKQREVACAVVYFRIGLMMCLPYIH